MVAKSLQKHQMTKRRIHSKLAPQKTTKTKGMKPMSNEVDVKLSQARDIPKIKIIRTSLARLESALHSKQVKYDQVKVKNISLHTQLGAHIEAGISLQEDVNRYFKPGNWVDIKARNYNNHGQFLYMETTELELLTRDLEFQIEEIVEGIALLKGISGDS